MLAMLATQSAQTRQRTTKTKQNNPWYAMHTRDILQCMQGRSVSTSVYNAACNAEACVQRYK